jgi:uncharacterized protein
MTPDLAAAIAYARERLARELGPSLTYHRVEHTSDDVVPAMRRLAEAEGVFGHALLLLETAAWFHDLGFVVQASGHEEIGIGFATDVLPGLGYSVADLDAVATMIRATRLPQTPLDLPSRVLADADLDVLGRDDFWERNQALRDELHAAGVPYTDEAWWDGQVAFVGGHEYFTATARALRDERKAEHVAAMKNRRAALG